MPLYCDTLNNFVEELPFKLDRPPPKKQVFAADWKRTHEELCTRQIMAWPADTTGIGQGFREREKDMLAICNNLFPAVHTDVWEFLDANHSVEWTLRLYISQICEKHWFLLLLFSAHLISVFGSML